MKQRFFMRISTKLITMQAVAMIAILAIVGFFQYRDLQDKLYADIERAGTTVSTFLRELIIEQPHLFSAQELQPILLRFTSKIPEIMEIEIFDFQRKLLCDSDGDFIPDSVRLGDARFEKLYHEKFQYQTMESDEDAKSLSIFSTIEGPYDAERKSDILGVVHIKLDLSTADRRIDESFLATMVNAVLLLGGFFILQLLFVIKPFARRLVHLTSITKKFGRGNYHARTDVAGSDELGTLAQAFNTMAQRIHDTMDAITQSERALRLAQEQVSLLLHSSPSILYRAHAHGNFDGIFASENIASVLGYPPEEFLEKDFWLRQMHPDDVQRVLQEVRRLFAEGEVEIEYRFRHKDGSWRWMMDVSHLRIDATGNPSEIFGTWIDVTERKLAEEKIREAQEQLQMLLSTSSSMLYKSKATGDYDTLFVSENVRSILGYEPEALLQPSFWIEHIHADDTQSVIKAINELFLHGAVQVEYRFLHRNGSWRWMYDEMHLRYDAQGLPEEIIGTWIDIDARKNAEEYMRTSSERMRMILASSASVYLSGDVDFRKGIITYASENVRDVLGYAPEEVMTKHFFARNTHPNDRRALYQAFLHLDDEQVVRSEYRIRHKDGMYRWMLFEARYLRNAEGKACALAGTMIDITDRKLAEIETQKMSAAISQIKDAVFITDADGNITYVNQAFENLYGYSPEEAIGKNPRLLRSGKMTREFYSQLWNTILAGGSFRAEIINRTKSGNEIIVDVRIDPVFGSASERVAFIAIHRDISLQKEAEAHLRKAKESAEQAAKTRSQFLANMSHEIRTPMNGIIGMTDLALETKLTEEQDHFLRIIKHSAGRLLTLIDDILDFSKIDSGKIEIHAYDFHLRSGIADALKEFSYRAAEKKLELLYQVHPDVPDVLIGDLQRLQQIIMNLVGNAMKFTEKGEIIIRVKLLGMENHTAELQFMVSDTGIGIAPEKIGTIFEEFSQAHSGEKKLYGGTGLGLAISSRFAELMGGRMWVESVAGEGSTFYFTIRCRVHKEALMIRQSMHEELRNLPVLIIDDNKTTRELFTEMLASWRMKAHSIGNGREALAELRRSVVMRRPYALILLDINMPGMDGFEFMKELRADMALRETPVIVVTMSQKPGDIDRMKELGVAAYQSKQFSQSDLLNKILAALAERSPQSKDALYATQDVEMQKPALIAEKHDERLRILLVEDNPVNQEVAYRLLTKRGHHVLVANDGEEALVYYERELFDVILMDVQLPGIDGFEATRRIRAREAQSHRHTPIIGLTAYALESDREQCIAVGMDDHVRKPIKLSDLVEAMDRTRIKHDITDTRVNEAPGAHDGLVHESDFLASVEGDRKLLRMVIDLFLVETPMLMQKLVIAYHDSEIQKAALHAHSIKGSCKQVFAEKVIAVAADTEQAAREGNLERIGELLPRLEQELNMLYDELKQMAARVE